jgi:hypothetical protein
LSPQRTTSQGDKNNVPLRGLGILTREFQWKSQMAKALWAGLDSVLPAAKV